MGKRLIPALVVTLAVALTSASGAGATTTSVVMSGLDNPRGLAFGPEGALYVAEAGRGGSGPCIVLRGAPQCYGPTGAVSRLWRGKQERVATGLPSYGSAASTTGPHDSNPYGLLAEPGSRVVADAGANALLRVAANGTVSTLAVFPARPNPTPIGPPFVDSVPTAVAVGPDGAYYVSELTGVPFAM